MSRYLLLFIVFLLNSNSSYSQETIEKIIQRHARALGGKAAWKKLKTYKMVIHRNAENGSFISVATMKRPDKYRLDFKGDGENLVKSFDGSDGWYNENGKISDMRPGEAIEMAEEGRYYEELALSQELNYKTKLLGKEELDGKIVYKILMQKPNNDRQYYYVDTNTYLIYMTSEFSEDKAYKGVEFKTKMWDYREVDGLLFPFAMELYANDQLLRSYKVDTIEVNPEILDILFKRPE